MVKHHGNREEKNQVVEHLLRNLNNHNGAPNRNKIGITFNDHFTNIHNLKVRGFYVYKVFEYKDNGLSNFLTLGIRTGMVTGYKYLMVNE